MLAVVAVLAVTVVVASLLLESDGDSRRVHATSPMRAEESPMVGVTWSTLRED
jgi:hypothetical protein